MSRRRGLLVPLLPAVLLAAGCAAPEPLPRPASAEPDSGASPERPWPGLAAAPAGDADGDGRADVLLLAAFDRPEPSGPAALRLYSGRLGRVLWERPVDLPAPGRTDGGVLLATSPGPDPAGPRLVLLAFRAPAGTLLIHELDPMDGRDRRAMRLEDVPGTATLELAPDLDGDGRPEVLLQDGGASRLHRLDGRPLPWRPAGDTGSGPWVRPALHPCGDLDGDGHGDLLQFAGETGGPQPASWTSPARAVSGRDGGVLAWLWEPLWYVFLAAARGHGDADGDGTPDLAWLARADQPGGGLRLQLYAGPDGERLLWERNWEGMPLRPGHLVWAGDLDADGRDDLALTLRGGWSGTVVVALSGTDGTLLAHHTESAGLLSPLEQAQRRLQGRLHPGFAVVLAPAGDTDGDGHDDLLVGTTAGPDRPLAHVRLYSGADGRILRILGGGPLARLLKP